VVRGVARRRRWVAGWDEGAVAEPTRARKTAARRRSASVSSSVRLLVAIDRSNGSARLSSADPIRDGRAVETRTFGTVRR